MISSEILVLLKNNKEINKFFKENEDFELLSKNLTLNERNRILGEYPNFMNKEIKDIVCLTLVKCNNDSSNYIKLKKVKIYIDTANLKIIKILQN